MQHNTITMAHVALVICALTGLMGCARSPQQRASKFLAEGKAHLSKGDSRRAILDFQNAISAVPRHAQARYQLGLAPEANHEFQQAVNAYRDALDLEPTHARAQLRLARVMASSSDPELLPDAENPLAELLRSAPSDPDT